MDANTEAIVRLAWSRILGLGDEAFAPVVGRRVYRQDDSAAAVMFVRIFGQSAFVGPGWACDAAGERDDDTLAGIRGLLQLVGGQPEGHGSRALGQGILAYTDEYVDVPAFDQVVSHEKESALALQRECPLDDVSEVGLAEMPHTYVLVEPDRPEVTYSGAGYVEWQGILAHLGVLTGLAHRRSGFGRAAAAVATNEALDAGLVPQWRARADNAPSRRVATALGYVEVGSQTTVLLPRPAS